MKEREKAERLKRQQKRSKSSTFNRSDSPKKRERAKTIKGTVHHRNTGLALPPGHANRQTMHGVGGTDLATSKRMTEIMNRAKGAGGGRAPRRRP